MEAESHAEAILATSESLRGHYFQATALWFNERAWINYQRTVDYPEEYNNGHHVMLDTEQLVTVRWEQVESLH